MKETNLNEYKITLGQVENNGLHLLSAKLDLSFNQVVTIALNDFLRRKLKTREFNALEDNHFINHLIGETINANRNIFGYDPQYNDIPQEKKYLLIK
jgi:hypothetical protein